MLASPTMHGRPRLRQLFILSLLSSTVFNGVVARAQGGVDSGLQAEPTPGAPGTPSPGDDRAQAREAYKAGAAAFAANDFAFAAKQFALAERLFHAPTNLLGLAQAQERLGQLVEAKQTFEAIAAQELANDAPDAFKAAKLEAQDAAQKLDQRLPRVVFAVLGGEPSRLTIDDRDVPLNLDAEIVVNPGQHTFKAFGTGTQSVPVRARLSEGTTIRVTLKLTNLGSSSSAEVGGSAAAGSLPAGSADSGGSSDNPWLIPGLVAIGVGAVGLGFGTSFLLSRNSKKREADRRTAECLRDADCPVAEQQVIAALDADVPRLGNLSLLTFGLGTAAVGAGVAMILLGGPSEKERATLSSVTPWIGPGQWGLSGRF